MMHEQHVTNDLTDAAKATASARPPRATPRVWTVFVALVVALVAAVGVQIVVAIGLVAWYVASGVDIQQVAQDLPARLTAPPVIIGMLLLGQITVGLAAFVPAQLSRQPTRVRLGLLRPALPIWGYPVVVIGSLAPLALGVALAEGIATVVPSDESARRIYDQMTLPWAVPLVLAVALAPGFMEELLFRGYVQRRLLERWRPWVAILVTSVLFGIFHVNPPAIVNAFVLGLWLGVLAWRTGAVWPGMLCHAFINGAWNTWHIGIHFGAFPKTPSTGVIVVAGVLIGACFLLSIWTLYRSGFQTVSDPLDREYPVPT
jgi:membrane protease YdiL (CAAX protease family)